MIFAFTQNRRKFLDSSLSSEKRLTANEVILGIKTLCIRDCILLAAN